MLVGYLENGKYLGFLELILFIFHFLENFFCLVKEKLFLLFFFGKLKKFMTVRKILAIQNICNLFTKIKYLSKVWIFQIFSISDFSGHQNITRINSQILSWNIFSRDIYNSRIQFSIWFFFNNDGFGIFQEGLNRKLSIYCSLFQNLLTIVSPTSDPWKAQKLTFWWSFLLFKLNFL